MKNNDNNVRKIFATRLNNMLELRYPGANSNEKAFYILQAIAPETAAACVTKTDKAAACRNIVKWLSGYSMPKQYSDLVTICRLLDCDSDYLLGIRHEYNARTHDTADYTGISENAVERIRDYGDFLHLLVSELTYGEDLLRKILVRIGWLVKFANGYFSWSRYGEDDPQPIKQYMSDKLLKAAIMDDFNGIIDSIQERCQHITESEVLKHDLRFNPYFEAVTPTEKEQLELAEKIIDEMMKIE